MFRSHQELKPNFYVSYVKGESHEILTSIFSRFQLIGAAVKQANVFYNTVSISPRYTITKLKISTLRSQQF